MAHGRAIKKARGALLWGAFFFVAAQVGLNAYIEWRRPDLYDPEYCVRFTALKARIAEDPSRPLLLLVGSSRTTMSFRPEILPPMRTPSGRVPLAFNFSHLGAGPAASLMEFRRLLDQGIRPKWLVVELMPPFLAIERLGSTTDSATATELPQLQRYFSPLKLYGNYVKSRLLPWHGHRTVLLHDVAPELLPSVTRPMGVFPLDPLGSWWVRETALSVVEADQVRDLTAIARASYFDRLRDFHILEGPARAVRDLLELCRDRRIKTVLVMTPESSAYRTWYSSSGRRELDRWCADLGRQYQVPVIDAREWLQDADFFDGHHVVLRGANSFTKRLASDVIEPLVEGRLTPTRFELVSRP
jgi:hypothetical protein